MPARSAVAVVVPFAGTAAQLAALVRVLETLRLRPDDELIVADNRPGRPEPNDPRVISAGEIAAPGYARNRGAARASAPWLVFLDADTQPGPDLLDAYFDPEPRPETAILAGAIHDVLPPGRVTAAARRTVARGQLSQTVTLGRAAFPYAQTANCAIRRDAFQQVGGFAEEARAGEDADLCFRLAAAGYGLETRPHAQVRHTARATLRATLRQLAIHGAGAAWCESRHPGSFPATAPRALLARVARSGARALAAGARGDRQAASFAALDIPEALAFELGRRRSNMPGPA